MRVTASLTAALLLAVAFSGCTAHFVSYFPFTPLAGQCAVATVRSGPWPWDPPVHVGTCLDDKGNRYATMMAAGSTDDFLSGVGGPLGLVAQHAVIPVTPLP